ncbi:SpoIIE family protein phosphatase [candidate division KSB1 bacterium]|nr:SpoIIE family protein phosphatase [candidate division KSB1 bacterium]
MKSLLKYFKSSLGFKIAVLLMLMIITLMSIVTYIFTIRELNLRTDQVKLRMEQLAKNIATIRSVETENWDIYQTYINNQVHLYDDIVYIAIFDEQDELKIYTLNQNWIDLGNRNTISKLEEANIVIQLEQRQIASDSQKDLESKSVNIIIGERNLGTVKVGFSLVQINDEIRYNLFLNLGLGIAFTLIAIVLAYYISHRIVTPLKRLTMAMLRISQGHFDEQVNIRSNDEVGDLARTFNYMTQGLSEKQLIQKFNAELGFTIDLLKIADLITNRITSGLRAENGYLFLQDNANLNTFRLMSRFPKFEYEEMRLIRNPQICELFLDQRKPLALDIFKGFNEFNRCLAKLNLGENSLVCPIVTKEKVDAILVLDEKKDGNPYTDDELQFLNTLIGQASFAIESAMLYQELTEQERLKHELEIAKKIQQSLLPQQNPASVGLEIDGICLPANEVGGDYYDFFKINDQTIGIAIADVTGKGTSAAFYMAVVKGIMISLSSVIESPRDLMIELNKRLYGTMDRRVFITMIYAMVNVETKQLRFARAGHNALLYRNTKRNTVDALTPEGIGLGLENGTIFDATVEEAELKLASGDMLVFYTDGVTEAMNKDLKEYSEQKLISIITQSNDASAAKLRKSILNDINRFVNDAPQHDDITLVTVRVL